MKRLTLSLFVGSLLALQGCADDLYRSEGLTLGAGDAMATNTALQVIDPWPEGVEETDFSVPSDRSAGVIPKTGDAAVAAPTPANP